MFRIAAYADQHASWGLEVESNHVKARVLRVASVYHAPIPRRPSLPKMKSYCCLFLHAVNGRGVEGG